MGIAMGKVTIKDVAREAGVSISTVSNALNGVNVLHPDTKAHILEVAERLHYVPNVNGRNLKAQATGVIGLFVGYMGGPYMGALTDSMARYCAEEGYELQVFVTSQSKSIMANLLGRRVDGAVITGTFLTAKQEKELREAKFPVVYLNREPHGGFQAGVFFDSYQAGRMAAAYLLEKGFSQLGLVEGPDNYDGRERRRGFLAMLAGKRIALRGEHIWQGGFARDMAYHTVKAFLEEIKAEKTRLPQAVFAANDLSAIGCIEAFMQAGIRVPQDIRVMGCDDIELGRYLTPTLTTIRTNFEEQGAVAVQCLLQMIRGENTGARVCLTCHLVERDSA